MRILIVDDSSQIRLVIQRYLSSIPHDYGLEFIHAKNGNEAKKHLQEGLLFDTPIELVFLDWHMPEKDGLEFLKEIRQTEAFKVFPSVIMLSAETYPQQIESCLAYNVITYLTKPFTEEEIHNAFYKAHNCLYGVRHAI
ncbi:MAG: response regulator [Bdellovibrio sp.]